jgi:hypothetical protein
MDETTRRDEPRENHRQVGSDARENGERSEKNQPRERGTERPGLTERERQERWPVG